MGALVFSIIFVLVALGMVAYSIFAPGKISRRVASGRDRYGDRQYETKEARNYAKIAVGLGAIVPVLFAGAIFGFSGFHTVPAKSVGVVTSYGKVVGEYGPGGHWLFPTKGMEIVQDTKQSDSYLASNNVQQDNYTPAGAVGNCIEIRLAGGNNGCADVRVQTQTDASAVPNLYQNYSSYGGNLTQDVDKYVVKTDLTTVLIRDLSDYNPIQDYSAQLEACDLSKAANCTSSVSQFSKFDSQLTADLQKMLGNEVTVYYVNLQNVNFDSTIEAALSKIQTAYEETAVAVQQLYTNQATQRANAALVTGNTLTPAFLQNECYTTTIQIYKDGGTPPTGWSCNGSNNASLILPGK